MNVTDSTVGSAAPRSRALLESVRSWSEGVSRYGAVLLLVVALFIVLSITQARFLTVDNIQNLLNGVSILWVVSMGMTFVVLTAGIDLSVGSLLALTGIFLSKVLSTGVPAWLGIILTLVFGAAVGGALNGVLIGRLSLSFFVVTLGSMVGLRGAVDLWSGAKTEYIDSSLIGNLGIGKIAGIPVPIWLMAVTFVLAFFVLRSTYFGRDVYAVGGNLEAARLSGINVSRTLIAVYAISGACAALGGLIQAGRIGAASPLVGQDIPLNAAAAVLLGGTSFMGGVGGVVGTAVGVLFIGVLQDGLGIAGVASFWQEVVTGVILIAAVLIDRIRQNTVRARVRRSVAGRAEVQMTDREPVQGSG